MKSFVPLIPISVSATTPESGFRHTNTKSQKRNYHEYEALLVIQIGPNGAQQGTFAVFEQKIFKIGRTVKAIQRSKIKVKNTPVISNDAHL